MVSRLLNPRQLQLGIDSKLLSSVNTPANILSLLITSPTGSLATSVLLNSLSFLRASSARRSCTDT